MLQTGHGGMGSLKNTVTVVEQEVARRPEMPVLVGEVSYEGFLHGTGAESPAAGLLVSRPLRGCRAYLWGQRDLAGEHAPGPLRPLTARRHVGQPALGRSIPAARFRAAGPGPATAGALPLVADRAAPRMGRAAGYARTNRAPLRGRHPRKAAPGVLLWPQFPLGCTAVCGTDGARAALYSLLLGPQDGRRIPAGSKSARTPQGAGKSPPSPKWPIGCW